MKNNPDSLWQPADKSSVSEPDTDIVLHVNNSPLIAKSGDTVATALLRAGYTNFGVHAKTGRPLAASCLMGVCFGCVCTIDGRPGTQACLEPVRNGLVITIDGQTQ